LLSLIRAVRLRAQGFGRLLRGERGGTSPRVASGTLVAGSRTGGRLDLDRHYIERKDFTVARRGYDQEEVDLHLRELADAISDLKAQLKATPAGVAGAAAEQVRQIVEAAEESAAQIEDRANAEARRVTDDASRRARETRERADQESAEQLQRVQETASKMLERAAALERELEALVNGIHEGATVLVDRMRSGAGDLENELGSIRQELLTVRPEPEPEPELAAASEEDFAGGAGWPSGAGRAAAGAANGAGEEQATPEPEAPLAAAEAPEPEAPTPDTRPQTPEPAAGLGGAGPEGARLVALNMALNGTPREEAARYLSDNFQLEDQNAILDDVYSRVGGRT
jgi:DivIVA domain-containing protein